MAKSYLDSQIANLQKGNLRKRTFFVEITDTFYAIIHPEIDYSQRTTFVHTCLPKRYGCCTVEFLPYKACKTDLTS